MAREAPEELDSIVEDMAAKFDREYLLQQMGKADAPAAHINSIDQVIKQIRCQLSNKRSIPKWVNFRLLASRWSYRAWKLGIIVLLRFTGKTLRKFLKPMDFWKRGLLNYGTRRSSCKNSFFG